MAVSISRTGIAFGRLKNEWALLPLGVRGPVHADLTILAKLACVLARGQATPIVAWLPSAGPPELDFPARS